MDAQELLGVIRRNYRPYNGYDTKAHLETLVRKTDDDLLPACVYVAARGILQVLEENVSPRLCRRLQRMPARHLFKVVALAAEKCQSLSDVAGWLERNVR